ncbi:urease accessory protein UreD [Devosia submarina]|uniref:urease accessory protein UreD n=1 Tax=Devosia submarina TaxID=1173082 RepID=UPI000D38EE40|nr:urease accessory protein UreD [Devosia submarina]
MVLSAVPVLQRARGVGRISVKMRDGRTALRTLFQEGCAKIRLPNSFDSSLNAVLINTAGGLTGGDHVRWEADVEAGGRLTVTTQACERVYKSLGNDAEIETRLAVGPDAHLDWMPQETILFEKGRLSRRISIDLDQTASLCAVEAVLLGRDAMGESARHACFADSWRIRRGGKLVHAEETGISGAPERERDGIALLAGASAFAIVLYVGADAERRQALLPAPLPGVGISRTGERLVVRVMAPSGLALRRLIVPIISVLSGNGGLPSLWTL